MDLQFVELTDGKVKFVTESYASAPIPRCEICINNTSCDKDNPPRKCVDTQK